MVVATDTKQWVAWEKVEVFDESGNSLGLRRVAMEIRSPKGRCVIFDNRPGFRGEYPDPIESGEAVKAYMGFSR